MLLSLLALRFVAACVIGTTQDLGYSAPETRAGTTWDLGDGLVVVGIDHAELNYHESAVDACDMPNAVSLAYVEDGEGPRLELAIEFAGTIPGDFSYDDSLSGTTNGTAQTFEHRMILVDGDDIMSATAGTGRVDVDKTGGSVQFTLAGLTFRDKEGVYGGTAAFDLSVGCLRLTSEATETEDGDAAGDCGWLQDKAPAKTEFCQEMTAGYSPDVVD